MSEDNVRQLPDLSIVLDLDAEERDEKDIRPPFVTKVGGKAITFLDPDEIDWRDLASVRQPGDMLQVSLNHEDLVHLREQDLPTWKFAKLMEGYYAHYGLEEKIRQAQRQASLGQGF